MIGIQFAKKAQLTILKDISGVIKPGRMTLLLGPPSSGKISKHFKNPSLSLFISHNKIFEMAISKASIVVLMMVIISVVASAQSEAPAPSPTSGSSAISASFVSAGVAAVAALVFGSALRI
jgi:hypothetical protein